MLTRSSFALAAIALAAVACDKNDNANNLSANAHDASVTTTNAPVATPPQAPPDPLANAENKDRVKQYPDEVKMSPTPGKIVTGVMTTVRESPHGTSIDTTETGMTVTELAKHGDYYLVLYPDPKAPGKELAGWVYKDAVESATWPGIGGATATNKGLGTTPAPANAKTAQANLKCKSGETHLRSNGDFCANTCKKDEDCKASPGGVCDGVAYPVKKDGTLESKMDRYCVLSSANVDRDAFKTDAGHRIYGTPGAPGTTTR